MVKKLSFTNAASYKPRILLAWDAVREDEAYMVLLTMHRLDFDGFEACKRDAESKCNKL